MGDSLDIGKIIDEVKKPAFVPLSFIDRPFDHKVKDKDTGIETIGFPVAAVPTGWALQSLKEMANQWRTKPERKIGNVTLQKEQSFVDFTLRNKNPDTSVLFASANFNSDPPSASIKAVFDYHPGSPDIEKTENCGYAAIYNFPVSRQFKEWVAFSGKGMTQKDFSDFLNNKIPDLGAADLTVPFDLGQLKPTYADPAQIFELSYGLSVNAKKKYYQHNKFMSGESDLQFTEEHEGVGGAPLKVPGWFIVNIPVLDGGSVYALPVRLRYAIVDERLQWTYDIWNAKEIFDMAFKGACDSIEAETELALFYGSV